MSAALELDHLAIQFDLLVQTEGQDRVRRMALAIQKASASTIARSLQSQVLKHKGYGHLATPEGMEYLVANCP